MNLVRLSLAYTRARPLNALLNVLLLALGIATIVVLLLFMDQSQQRLTRDARGIDLVVGAPGSPLQLILSSVFHADVPTGNIPLAEARRVMAHSLVAQTIPLALGDSYRGYRIVGTDHAYVRHYQAQIGSGRLWKAPMEAALGARVAAETGLRVGDRFVGSHGLTPGGHAHDDAPTTVVGVLATTGTVLDRLILTSVETVWLVHDEHHHPAGAPGRGTGLDDGPFADHGPQDHPAGDHGHRHDKVPEAERSRDHDRGHGHEQDPVRAGTPEQASMPERGDHHSAAAAVDALDLNGDDREITALLVRYRSPLAAATLPRFVNSQGRLQAASPAFETARLFRLLGFGVEALRAFGYVLVAAAGLGLFIALYNALRERRYDLAVMRSLGATRGLLFRHVIMEALLLVTLGTALGLALGHGAAELAGQWLMRHYQMELRGWTWVGTEIWLIGLAFLVGMAAALLPALQAYRTDVAATLARGGPG